MSTSEVNKFVSELCVPSEGDVTEVNALDVVELKKDLVIFGEHFFVKVQVKFFLPIRQQITLCVKINLDVRMIIRRVSPK